MMMGPMAGSPMSAGAQSMMIDRLYGKLDATQKWLSIATAAACAAPGSLPAPRQPCAADAPARVNPREEKSECPSQKVARMVVVD